MQTYLFCTDCPLYGECGGAKTSPCGCMFLRTEKAYSCNTCRIGCREREANDGDFLTHVLDGLDLKSLVINQGSGFHTLPLVIPVKGGKSDVQLPVNFAAVDLGQLIAFYYTQEKNKTIHERIRVPEGIPLIGVVNSTDDILERFWGLPSRSDFLEVLSDAGVVAMTGPTFSIMDTFAGRPTVDSHHVLMLRRHHQVMSEVSNNGMLAIPNLYFRNQFDINYWADWLSKNEISIISRDFSMTKNISSFLLSEIEMLKEIIEKSGKVYHILFTGVGSANATFFTKEFAKVGCRCSFITSDPMQKAIRGGRKTYYMGEKLHSIKHLETKRQLLIYPNYVTLEEQLKKIAESLACYSTGNIINFKRESSQDLLRIAA